MCMTTSARAGRWLSCTCAGECRCCRLCEGTGWLECWHPEPCGGCARGTHVCPDCGGARIITPVCRRCGEPLQTRPACVITDQEVSDLDAAFDGMVEWMATAGGATTGGRRG